MKTISNKMSKAVRVFLVWGIVAILTGCSQATPASNLPQNITVNNDGSRPDSETGSNNGNEEKQGTGETDQREQKEGNGAFGFMYEGVTLIPGEVFEPSVL